MAKDAKRTGATVPMIGIDASELRWVRTLITLLRHPDPVVAELTRHALDYLTESAASRQAPGISETPPLDSTG